MDKEPLISCLKSGDRRALAKCNTLVESKHLEDRQIADQLIEAVWKLIEKYFLWLKANIHLEGV